MRSSEPYNENIVVILLSLFVVFVVVDIACFFCQSDAKRAVAIALRNRWRRTKLDEELKVR